MTAESLEEEQVELATDVLVVDLLLPSSGTLLMPDGAPVPMTILQVVGRRYRDGKATEEDMCLAIHPATAGYVGALMATIWGASCMDAIHERNAADAAAVEKEGRRREPSAYL